MTTKKEDEIQLTLNELINAASSLGCHGAGGYSTETSALDVVFVRALVSLKKVLRSNPDWERYDPEGLILNALPNSSSYEE